MTKPPKLNRGDRIRITASASPVRPELFDQGVQVVRELGFEPVFDDVTRKWRYLAGTDEERLLELRGALRDPQSKAIFFARGGYGSGRLLPGLLGEFEPRILLGCSDITSIHLYFQSVYRWVVFHGPMPSGDFARGQLHRESLELAMTQTGPYELRPEGVQALVPGSMTGPLAGGCLTLLEASLGTRWEPEWEKCVLFMEDVAVKPYQIDRMLTHLKETGKLSDVQGFIFGEMKDCVQVENQGYTVQEVILDVLENLDKPIYFGFPSGHVSGLNWTLPLGVPVRATAEPDFRLEILEGAVQ